MRGRKGVSHLRLPQVADDGLKRSDLTLIKASKTIFNCISMQLQGCRIAFKWIEWLLIVVLLLHTSNLICQWLLLEILSVNDSFWSIESTHASAYGFGPSTHAPAAVHSRCNTDPLCVASWKHMLVLQAEFSHSNGGRSCLAGNESFLTPPLQWVH